MFSLQGPCSHYRGCVCSAVFIGFLLFHFSTLLMNVPLPQINDKIVCLSSVVHILDALTCEIRSNFCRLTAACGTATLVLNFQAR